jgi:lysophospholipase L1-like esterase
MSDGGPFRRMVVLGDSIAYGMCATEPRHEWAQVAANLLRDFQDGELVVLNRGLPAGVISPRCPGYAESAKPSLMERYRRHCIDLRPDLVVIAEGLNDLRSGMPVAEYVADLEHIVGDIRDQTGALIVLLGIYHQTYGVGANDPAVYPTWSRWTHEIAAAYEHSIRLVADSFDAVFVDTLRIMGGADWLLHIDACHLNDLGHVLVGNGVFEAIARHTRSLADPVFRTIEERDVSILNTGGADADDEIRGLWADALGRFTSHMDEPSA